MSASIVWALLASTPMARPPRAIRLDLGVAARQQRAERCLGFVVAFGAQFGGVLGDVDTDRAFGPAHAIGCTGVDPLVLVLAPELRGADFVASSRAAPRACARPGCAPEE